MKVYVYAVFPFLHPIHQDHDESKVLEDLRHKITHLHNLPVLRLLVKTYSNNENHFQNGIRKLQNIIFT